MNTASSSLDTHQYVRPANGERLREAYTRLHAWGPEWGGEGGENGLANHGPMAVEILSRRGMESALEPWLDGYVGRLEDLPRETERITADNWADAMGVRTRVGDWTSYFERAVRESPWQEVLVEWWPRLLPVIASAATHGLIRTGHAVRTVLGGDESQVAIDEVAHALGYWAARAIHVPGLAAPAGDLDPAAALAALPRLPEQRGVIRDRFARLGDFPEWTPSLTTLRSPLADSDVPGALTALTTAGVKQYTTLGHGSSVLLVHVATAPNAMRQVFPVLPTELWAPSYAATWAACAAITVSYAGTERERPIEPTITDHTELIARAAEHGDEHAIKLTDTVLDIHDATGDDTVLAAAAKVVELIAVPV